MRLSNKGKFGNWNYRVMLDDKKFSANYIERAKGCYRDDEKGEHLCENCKESINWIHWNKANTKSKCVCSCGNQCKLEISSFSWSAERHI